MPTSEGVFFRDKLIEIRIGYQDHSLALPGLHRHYPALGAGVELVGLLAPVPGHLVPEEISINTPAEHSLQGPKVRGAQGAPADTAYEPGLCQAQAACGTQANGPVSAGTLGG